MYGATSFSLFTISELKIYSMKMIIITAIPQTWMAILWLDKNLIRPLF